MSVTHSVSVCGCLYQCVSVSVSPHTPCRQRWQRPGRQGLCSTFPSLRVYPRLSVIVSLSVSVLHLANSLGGTRAGGDYVLRCQSSPSHRINTDFSSSRQLWLRPCRLGLCSDIRLFPLFIRLTETSHLPHLANSFGRARAGGDYVLMRASAVSPCFHRRTVDCLLSCRRRMDGRHQPCHD